MQAATGMKKLLWNLSLKAETAGYNDKPQARAALFQKQHGVSPGPDGIIIFWGFGKAGGFTKSITTNRRHTGHQGSLRLRGNLG